MTTINGTTINKTTSVVTKPVAKSKETTPKSTSSPNQDSYETVKVAEKKYIGGGKTVTQCDGVYTDSGSKCVTLPKAKKEAGTPEQRKLANVAVKDDIDEIKNEPGGKQAVKDAMKEHKVKSIQTASTDDLKKVRDSAKKQQPETKEAKASEKQALEEGKTHVENKVKKSAEKAEKRAIYEKELEAKKPKNGGGGCFYEEGYSVESPKGGKGAANGVAIGTHGVAVYQSTTSNTVSTTVSGSKSRTVGCYSDVNKFTGKGTSCTLSTHKGDATVLMTEQGKPYGVAVSKSKGFGINDLLGIPSMPSVSCSESETKVIAEKKVPEKKD